MTIRLFIILLLLTTRTFSQNWISIPKTDILFSNYGQNEKSNRIKFEYFKKGDSIIAVSKYLADDFKNVFSSDKKAFNDIYKVAYQVIDKSELIFDRKDPELNSLDSVIASIKFKTTVIINNREFVSGVNEVIWVLANGSRDPLKLGGACFINMVFKKGSAKKRRKYISTIKSHIEL
jgi:hypothetical protein